MGYFEGTRHVTYSGVRTLTVSGESCPAAASPIPLIGGDLGGAVRGEVHRGVALLPGVHLNTVSKIFCIAVMVTKHDILSSRGII